LPLALADGSFNINRLALAKMDIRLG